MNSSPWNWDAVFCVLKTSTKNHYARQQQWSVYSGLWVLPLLLIFFTNFNNLLYSILYSCNVVPVGIPFMTCLSTAHRHKKPIPQAKHLFCVYQCDIGECLKACCLCTNYWITQHCAWQYVRVLSPGLKLNKQKRSDSLFIPSLSVKHKSIFWIWQNSTFNWCIFAIQCVIFCYYKLLKSNFRKLRRNKIAYLMHSRGFLQASVAAHYNMGLKFYFYALFITDITVRTSTSFHSKAALEPHILLAAELEIYTKIYTPDEQRLQVIIHSL